MNKQTLLIIVAGVTTLAAVILLIIYVPSIAPLMALVGALLFAAGIAKLRK